MKVSIIIVNYNSGTFLRNCLTSISDYVTVAHEIIIVDNASTDTSFSGSRKEFEGNPNYIFIQSKENLGFAKANNLGAQYATGDFLHFLNPDTLLRSDIDESYNIAFRNTEKIYVHLLENPDGSIINQGHRLPLIGVIIKSLYSGEYPKWYLGASVLAHKSMFDFIGKWNEAYWMFAEDLDLFYNCYRKHVAVEILPSVVYHAGGVSYADIWSTKEKERIVNKSTKLFFKINKIYWQYLVLRVMLGMNKIFKNVGITCFTEKYSH